MFGCCCVNKKALKKEQQKADAKANDINKSIKSPADVGPLKSPTKNDKSNSSDDDNNLSGLIMSDGLVGEEGVRPQGLESRI